MTEKALDKGPLGYLSDNIRLWTTFHKLNMEILPLAIELTIALPIQYQLKKIFLNSKKFPLGQRKRARKTGTWASTESRHRKYGGFWTSNESLF